MSGSPGVIDLRSDTVTRPSAEMRTAMASAAVGDDVFGEDPSANLLQERIASLLGKESALWLPSGTMANQVALRALTRPGDDVIVSRESHAEWHETGGAGANAGVQLTAIGSTGCFTVDEFVAAVHPRDHMLYPPTTLVQIENTHNRAGGVVFPQDEAERICRAAGERGVATFLDGARLWNASAASGRSVRELAAPFDVVSVALSKGLGAPAGSVLAGPRHVMQRCVRYRRMSGGAMRQVGILAAAGLYAIERNVGRLADDHLNARRIADRMVSSRRVLLDLRTVQTNIVVAGLAPDAPDAATVISRAKERGVLIVAFGPRVIRLVTHLDVTTEQCARAADVVMEVIGE